MAANIISVSRRTDIPAYYAKWFIKRIKERFCLVPNPFNRSQVSRISLKRKDVVAFVFWTRNPRPLMPYLNELDKKSYPYYFQYTVVNNPREIDPHTPSLRISLKTFVELSEMIGAEKVIWRYDPIIFSEKTDPSFHLEQFSKIASTLEGKTNRCVISIIDDYKKSRGRMNELSKLEGFSVKEYSMNEHEAMLKEMAKISEQHGMEITSCAEEVKLKHLGIEPGKCIDNNYINKIFNIKVTKSKDKSQREVCGCVKSRDIGVYDTCLMGCKYCYATRSFQLAEKNLREHQKYNIGDHSSPSILADIKDNEDNEIEKKNVDIPVNFELDL